jgi:thiaminase (transcriptional activator TenA)
MKFTDQLWEDSQPIFDQIIQHPFNQELSTGTLSIEKFKFYIHQDSLYLADFSKALAIIAAKAPDSQLSLAFLDFARNAVIVEKILHESYFKEYTIDSEAGKAPGCFTYTNYLIATCSLHSFEVAVAAVLPCFWIYQKVGDIILSNQKKPNPYQNWIDTYSGEDFNKSVNSILAICNKIAENTSQATRREMLEKYQMASRLEYMFWDSAYRLEQWPV